MPPGEIGGPPPGQNRHQIHTQERQHIVEGRVFDGRHKSRQQERHTQQGGIAPPMMPVQPQGGQGHEEHQSGVDVRIRGIQPQGGHGRESQNRRQPEPARGLPADGGGILQHRQHRQRQKTEVHKLGGPRREQTHGRREQHLDPLGKVGVDVLRQFDQAVVLQVLAGHLQVVNQRVAGHGRQQQEGQGGEGDGCHRHRRHPSRPSGNGS